MKVGEIREAIWRRQDGECIHCGAGINLKTMHMHEKVFRSRGGKISLENSEGLCYPCHLGPYGKHPEKRLNWRKSSKEIAN